MFDVMLSFTAGLFADIFWVLYVTYMNDKKKNATAVSSVAIGLCTLIFVMKSYNNLYNGISWLTGLYFGTHLGFVLKDYIDRKI